MFSSFRKEAHFYTCPLLFSDSLRNSWAGRGWQSQRAGTRPGLLYTDAAEGRHAILHVEEELLIEEARNIKKEVRRRGLTERVNALLRERKFEGELIS